MRKYRLLTIFIFLGLSPTTVTALNEECGDFACYFRTQEQNLKLEKEQQKQELEAYREQQLSLQQAQLEQTAKQNELLEAGQAQMEQQREEADPILSEPELEPELEVE